MAADRLNVLRSPNEQLMIMLFEADLVKSQMPKDKRQDLMKDIPDEELISP